MTTKVLVKKLSEEAKVPKYMTQFSVGSDLFSVADVRIAPGEVARIPIGIAIELPNWLKMFIMPRSGLSSKGIVAIPGTIDSDYRGEINVQLMNARRIGSFSVHVGDRIAQGVIGPVTRVAFEVVDELGETERGEGGFGHTGVGG